MYSVSAISIQIDWLNGVLSCFQQYFSHITATARIIHVSLSWVSPVLAWGSKVSCPRTLPRKQRIQYVFKPRALDHESNSLPLSKAGSLISIQQDWSLQVGTELKLYGSET